LKGFFVLSDREAIDMILPIFPILWLLAAISSILWYQRTANDIFYALGIASAIIALIWGLIIAHWSFLLLALIFLLKMRSPSINTIQIKIDK
jgi:hypothetical protein